MNIFEIVGFLATTCIVIGFCFKSVKLIRILNLTGSVLFVVYGLYIGATYTWVANAIMIFINGYYLLKNDDKKPKDDKESDN